MMQKDKTYPRAGTATRNKGFPEQWMKKAGEVSDSSPGGEDQAALPRVSVKKATNLKIPRKDLIYFVGQLGIMFDTGLNLMTALECLAVQAKNPALKRLVEDIRQSISEGNPLWVAMKRHPRIFTPVCLSMVRAGEVSGNMAEILESLESFLERQNDIRLRVKSALSYPVFMLVISLGVLIFLLTYVFPKFEVIFEGNEDVLPAPTKFFLGLSHLCSGYWYILFPAVALVIGSAVWAWQQDATKNRLDPWLLRIPLVGDLLVKMSLSRSFHTLSLMLEGGIPILDALKMARDVAGNQVFNDTWTRVSTEVENGRDISEPLRRNPHIPPSEIQMITMGDRSGMLHVILGKLSHRYEKEIDLSVKTLIRFIEPALVIGMGVLVGLIVLSLILPVFAMSRAQS